MADSKMSNRKPMTEFGIEVHLFCARYCITKKELALMANVPYISLMDLSRGKRAGHKSIPKLKNAMAAYVRRNNAPQTKLG